MSRGDWLGVIFWAAAVAVCLAFWAGVGYAASLAFQGKKQQNPPAEMGETVTDSTGIVCVYSGLIDNPDHRGQTSSAFCTR